MTKNKWESSNKMKNSSSASLSCVGPSYEFELTSPDFSVPVEEIEVAEEKPYGWVMYRLNDSSSTEGFYLLHRYNRYGGFAAAPDELSSFLISDYPVGFASYKGSGQKWGSVSSYIMKASQDSLDKIVKEEIGQLIFRNIPDEPLPDNVNETYNIKGEYSNIDKVLGEAGLPFKSIIVPQIIQRDIMQHCIEYPAKATIGPVGFSEVGVVTKPGVARIKPVKHRLTSSGKGNYWDVCDLDYGTDPYLKCVVHVNKQKIYDPSGKCQQCYAGHKNNGDASRTGFEFDVDYWIHDLATTMLETRRAARKEYELAKTILKPGEILRPLRPIHSSMIIRIGVSVEPNIPPEHQRDLGEPKGLKTILQGIIALRERKYADGRLKKKVSSVMTTRMPTFDDEMMDLIKRAGTNILVSVGYDELEKGIRNLDYPVERRLECTDYLIDQGINAGLFVNFNFAESIELAHREARLAMDWMKKNQELGRPARVLALESRIPTRKLAPIMGFDDWDKLKRDRVPGMFEDRKWILTGQNFLAPFKSDDSFMELAGAVRDAEGNWSGGNIGDFRLCNVHDGLCGHCFITYDGKPRNVKMIDLKGIKFSGNDSPENNKIIPLTQIR
jgi:hypothetical protein